MKARPTGLLVIALALLASCAAEKSPPFDAAHYAVEIVFCDQEAKSPGQVCAEPNPPAATMFANVLGGNVAGRVVQIEMDGPIRGTVKGDEFYVRRGQTFSEWVEISRESSCREFPCKIAISVYVDYQLILTEWITFI